MAWSLTLLLASGPAGAKSRSHSIRLGSQADHFPAIRARADRVLERTSGDVRIRVHHVEGEEEVAARAAEIAAAPLDFLTETTGRTLRGEVSFYLSPLSPGEEPPASNAGGRGLYTEVFFFEGGKPLLSVPRNRDWYLETYTHELAHHVLEGDHIRDRWLNDGLAEYLRGRFQAHAEEVGLVAPGRNRDYVLTLADWNPPIASLLHAEARPWTFRDAKPVLELRKKDPLYAMYVAESEIWRYSAAAELLSRWMAAARVQGIERPVADLLARVKRRGGTIRWPEVNELLHEQTGTTFTKLMTPTREELDRARDEAWRQRDDAYLGRRLRALRTLGELGLPKGADAAELLGAFTMPEGVADAEHLVWQLHQAASAAVARGESAAAVREAYARLREAHGEKAYFFGSPELWGRLAEQEARTAADLLIDVMTDGGLGLSLRERANEILEELTGRNVGWSVTLPPRRRLPVAEKWKQVEKVKQVEVRNEVTTPALSASPTPPE